MATRTFLLDFGMNFYLFFIGSQMATHHYTIARANVEEQPAGKDAASQPSILSRYPIANTQP